MPTRRPRRGCPVRVPADAAPLLAAGETHRPGLTRAQRAGLVWRVSGAVRGGNARRAAAVDAREPPVGPDGTGARRRRRRAWGDAGADTDAPCRADVDARACSAPLLGWPSGRRGRAAGSGSGPGAPIPGGWRGTGRC